MQSKICLRFQSRSKFKFAAIRVGGKLKDTIMRCAACREWRLVACDAKAVNVVSKREGDKNKLSKSVFIIIAIIRTPKH